VRIRSFALILLLTTGSSSFAAELLLQFKAEYPQRDSERAGNIIAVTISPDGSLYFLEDGANTLVCLSSNGSFIGKTGGFGFGEDSFHKPTDLTFVGLELWVSDPLGGRIIRFDRRLAPLDVLSETGIDRINRIKRDNENYTFERPVSLAQAENGDLVILEQDRQEVLMLDASGRLLRTIGQYGEVPQPLVSPNRLEISEKGVIAITDPGNRSIFLFDRFGSFLQQILYKDIQDKQDNRTLLAGESLSGVDWRGDELWVCGAWGLARLDNRLQLIQIWSNDFFPGGVQDLAIDRDRLVVASGKSLMVYRIVE